MSMEKVKALLAELKTDRDALAAKSQPLKDARRKLQEKTAPIDAEIRSLTMQIREIEGEELVKLDKSIGSLTRSLGARSLSAESKQPDEPAK